MFGNKTLAFPLYTATAFSSRFQTDAHLSTTCNLSCSGEAIGRRLHELLGAGQEIKNASAKYAGRALLVKSSAPVWDKFVELWDGIR